MNDPTKPGLQGWMPSNFLPQILVGSNSIGARFGMNVVSGGDIDRNGYNDVVIGAPHEGDSVGGSGAVYIYYTDSNGLSESRKQKILGSEVFFPLHGFGTSIIQGDAGKFDVDNNLYPDVVASAPSSDSVLVLLSRPIVDVSAEIIINSPVINFLNCLDDINKTCTTFHLCFNASQRMNPTASNFEMDVTISLDSMISNTQDKRLIFKDSETSTINNIQIITNHKECNSYNVTLNGISFSNLVKGNVFETIPEVNVTYRFTQAHQNKRLSAILDPFVPTTLSKTWALSNNCLKSSRKCTHDLVALAQYSLPSSSRPYVLGQNSKLFEVNVTVRNDGPDLSYFTKISITSRQLRFSKVIGDCVQVIDSESDVLLLGISLPSISSNTGIFPQGSSCNFLLQYPLETIANLGTISEIFVNGSIYSSLSAATGNEVNEGNNHFQYRRQVRYSAKLRISRISFPSTLYYNRSLAPTFARTLNDPVLGGNTSNLNHSYVITNNGPHMVTTASLIYSWPASFLNNTNIPLLYLYDFQCMPSSICKCDVEGKINPFNLSFANKSDSNVHLEFPQLDQFPEGTECSSINCEMIKCTLTNFKQYQSVRIMSSLKTWLPSFSSPDSVALESTLVVNISESLISKTNKLVYYAQAVTTVAKYTPPTSTNPDAANNLGAIIGGIIGGIVLLIVIGFILWKAGFFQSKYSEMLNDAKEDADVEPQGAQASDEDILNQT